MFQIGGTTITGQSKKQSRVALSIAEAEYVALFRAAQEAVWLKQLNQDLTGISSLYRFSRITSLLLQLQRILDFMEE